MRMNLHCAHLKQALLDISEGHKYISPALAQELANAWTSEADRPLHENLSDREFQTLCFIASGKSLSEISIEMCLSPKTVSVYRARMMEKLKISNNSELVRYAIKHKLVD